MRANELAGLLARDAEVIARQLLPSGKRVGNEWEVGDLDDAPGHSLRVHLTGDKAGVWSDFSTGESGDLIGLWMARRRVSLRDACQQAMQALGVTDRRAASQPMFRTHKSWNKPTKKGVHKLTDEHRKWLEEVRNIPSATIAAYRLASRDGRVMFPYLEDDELVFAKYRNPEVKKDMRVDAGCKPILFGWQAIPKDARTLTISEGECFPGDAQVLTRHGWVALGGWRGGEVAQYRDGKIEWIEPLARIAKPWRGEMVRHESKGYVSITTPGHNLVSIDLHGKEYKHTALDGPRSKMNHIPRCGFADGPGIDLTDDQIRFCLAVSADAAIDHRTSFYGESHAKRPAAEPRYVRFGFKKYRKVERLRKILAGCGLAASDTVISEGYRSICLSIPSWVPGRFLPWEWIADASRRQREMILDEIVYWDGNRVPHRNQTEYSSKYDWNAEWVQALSHTSGRVSTIIHRENAFGKWLKASILHGKQTTSWQGVLNNGARRVPYDGMVYCLTVPSGKLLVRQEEKITVTGNCDSLALHAYGHPAVSVPLGAGNGGKQGWVEHEFARLAVYDTIYLCMDDDKEGAIAALDISQRLGRERCRVVKFPKKDANECLMTGVDKAVIDQCFADARYISPDKFKFLSDYHHELDTIMDAYEHGETGIHLPWENPKEPLLLRDGEVSMWVGIDGHGKSAVVQQIMLGAISQELDGAPIRCCAASLEYRPEMWAYRIIRQGLGADPLKDRGRTHRALDKLAERVYLFDAGSGAGGTTSIEEILEVFEYAARCYGARLFILDNLTRLDFAEDDSRGQKALINRICGFATQMNVHIMVVAHVRKTPQGESATPGKQDIRGHGSFSNSPATVVIVWRNKPKETIVKEGSGDPEVLAEPDTYLTTCKQRGSLGYEPVIKLWFDIEAQQFLGSSDAHSAPMACLSGL